MKHPIAFLTTIYPTKKQHLFDFFNSLNNQTFKHFDIIVVNDKYENFSEIIRKYPLLNIIELPYSKSPAKNREYGINYVLNSNYQYLIFGDSDDYFSSNRVEKSLEYLQDFDIVVNDVSLFDNKSIYSKKYFSNRIKNNFRIDLDFIKDKNIFGLSNTAICTTNINEIKIPENIVAVDWYIFTSLLIDEQRAVFSNKMITFYRQHEKNLIGLKAFTNEQIQNILNVKSVHYYMFLKSSNIYKILYTDIQNRTIQNIKKTNAFSNQKFKFWWEIN